MDNVEIWKDCKGYEGRYQISSLGRIWSISAKKCLSTRISNKGYETVRLYTPDGKCHTESVHRLLALAFIPNPNNLPQVNHKNELKTDNRLENLEWCDAKYNMNYGSRTERASVSKGKPIAQYDLSDNLITTFSSIKEASEQTGVGRQNIEKVLHNRGNTAGHYKWRFL